jgi:hypothetical protein
MANDTTARVRYGVALNPNTSEIALASLARDASRDVRAMVARNPSTPEALLDELARDSRSHVRVSLARNPACPQRLLRRLLQDSDGDVHNAALRRIDPATLGVSLDAALADERLRAILAANQLLPTALLTTLAQRLDPAINRLDYALAQALAGNPATPAEALDLLARIPNKETQALVAHHPHTTPATLAWLCANVRGNAAMSLNLARNPATSNQALEDLAETDALAVTQALIAQVNLTPTGCDRFYRRLLRYHLRSQGPPFAPESYGASKPQVAPDTNRFLCLVAMASPLLEEADYAHGVVSPVWSERYMLALNPVAPRALVEALTHDGNRYVRAAARMSLATRDRTSQPQSSRPNRPADGQPQRRRVAQPDASVTARLSKEDA